MKINFAERLQTLVDVKKISQADLAKGVSASEPMVTNWLNGKTKSVRRTTLQKLAHFFGCNIEWLATGKGEMFPPAADRRQPELTITGNGNIQAGGKISGSRSVVGHQGVGLQLDSDEQRLILRLREVGGKKMLKKFLRDLDKLEELIERS